MLMMMNSNTLISYIKNEKQRNPSGFQGRSRNCALKKHNTNKDENIHK